MFYTIFSHLTVLYITVANQEIVALVVPINVRISMCKTFVAHFFTEQTFYKQSTSQLPT